MGGSRGLSTKKGGIQAKGWTLLVGVFLAGCGASQPAIETRNLVAPQSEAQTGYLVTLDNKSESEIEARLQSIEQAGGRVRTINMAHGLFEVYGLSQNDLARIVPVENIQKNKFWRKKDRVRMSHSFLQSYCPEVPTAPTMTLTALPADKHIEAETPAIFKRDGKPLLFKVNFPVVTNYRWEIYGPPASALSNQKILDGDLSFTPDELGEYNVFLLVKLPANKVCWRRYMIGVTDNTPYAGKQTVPELPEAQKLTQFPHLATLGMPAAWKLTRGAGVNIAILDTGIDYNHPDLASSLLINTADVVGDRKDNDNDKFIDDYIGWDFVNNDNLPYDDEMHGTHVAGLAASLVGVAPGARILPIKVLGPFGGDMGTLAGGIYYAVDRGVKIINLSLGGSGLAPVIERAFAYAQQRGVLVVVAAGNEAEDIDVNPTYPASLPNLNILTVAATNFAGALTTYTNVGAKNVDVACPGGSEEDGGLSSAFYNNRLGKRYVKAKGTSMAAPLVTGLAALVAAAFPNFNALEIKNYLIGRGISRPDYQGRIASQKLVSATNLFTPTPVGPRP